jgi:hypothetical protein
MTWAFNFADNGRLDDPSLIHARRSPCRSQLSAATWIFIGQTRQRPHSPALETLRSSPNPKPNHNIHPKKQPSCRCKKCRDYWLAVTVCEKCQQRKGQDSQDTERQNRVRLHVPFQKVEWQSHYRIHISTNPAPFSGKPISTSRRFWRHD